ncbi:hypothetical protein RZS08_43900, partial [Arthrospira platensis SPKY1]|nr:hypothetical protein [Arthrospira platensis SPKY1]
EVINKHKAQIYIKSDRKSKYNELSQKSADLTGPDFAFEVGDLGSFDEQMLLLRKEGIEIDPIYKTRQDWIGPVLSWLLPIGILIAVWIFLMRRMGSAGGPGAQIFNIGKSRAALFDK